MLQTPYLGGVWTATKDLIRSVAELNRVRGQLDLTFGIRSEQTDIDGLEQFLPLEKLKYAIVPADQLGRVVSFDALFASDDTRRDSPHFSVVANSTALNADAWIALVDRFWAPLLPDRPYGVIVYDMIQHYCPEAFEPEFFQMYEQAMKPTVHYADLVMTTNAVTQEDVRRFIGNANANIRRASVSFEVEARFVGCKAERVQLPRTPFILNVNNGSPHKGIELMLRGQAKLCSQLGAAAPLLVVCGNYTQAYTKNYKGPPDLVAWKTIRQLVVDLKLVEGRDVIFLGHVSDDQLLYLFQECRMAVNSARYDNGSFNLIEANYYGKPALSNRYPAAEWLYDRFQIPVRYFPIDDAEGLATAMREAMQTPALDLTAVRQNLHARRTRA